MRAMTFLAATLCVFVALPALAQNAPQGTPTRVRGTVEKLDGQTLTIKSKDGQAVPVTLTENVTVTALVKKTIADFKPGDTVASTGIKGTDGKLHAIEVRQLPRPFADGGRQFAWDLSPDSVMTNATVGTITSNSDGAVFHVTYKDGEADYTVGPETVVLANSAADTSLLVRGAAVVAFGTKQDDGKIVARLIFAEKDGVKPPM
jgi:hypothetical protein